MPRRPNLTVAELKSLLLALLKVQHRHNMKLQIRFSRELGNEVQTESSEMIEASNKLLGFISDALARRLKRNRRFTSLLSSREIVQYTVLVIKEAQKIEGYKFNSEERKMIVEFLKAQFEGMLETAFLMMSPDKNLYDELWKSVTTVLDLATELGISPTDFLVLDDSIYRLTRRRFTKKQSIANYRRVLRVFEKKGKDPDLSRELEVMSTLFKEEVERIYAKA